MNKLSYRVREENIMLETEGERSRITYFSPKHPNDLKRIGREMVIRQGRSAMVLNGTAIRSLSLTVAKLDVEREFGWKGLAIAKNRGKKFRAFYISPIGRNDLKREGQDLSIEQDNTSMTIKGSTLRSLRSMLEKIEG